MTTTTVTSGNTVSNIVLNLGDTLNVLSGGSATGTIVNNAGQELIQSGGAASSSVVNVGGTISANGSLTNTVVQSGGTESVYQGGTTTGSLVKAGGTQLMHVGSLATNTTVNGVENVDGTTTDTIVNSGGLEGVYSGGVSNGTVLTSSGSGQAPAREVVNPNGVANGTTIEAGASLKVLSGGTATATTIGASGTLFLEQGATASNGITFTGGNAILDISGTSMPSVVISGLDLTDQIDLSGLTYASSNTVTVSGNTVKVTGAGGASATLTIAGAQSDVFSLRAETDGDTGTALVVTGRIGNPVVSSPTLTVGENTAATAIGIAAPTDPNYSAAQLTITAGALPTDGTVTLADGTTAVTAGQVLTSAQLTGLLFTPAAGQFSTSSAFTYGVTDPAGNASTGTASLGVLAAGAASYAIAATGADLPDGLLGLTPYNFTVTRTGDVTQAASLTYEVTGSGTTPAPAGLFSNPTGQVTFAAGATAALLTVNVIGTSITGPETFSVAVSGPAGTSVTGGAATGTITPNTTIDNSVPNAANIASWAAYYLAQASSVSGGGTGMMSTTLDGNGDTAVFSTPDAAGGHVISATGTGQSVIAAGSGADTITVDNGADLLATGLGHNTVYLQGGNNQLRSEGTDTINVGAGMDQIEIGGAAIINPSDATLIVTLDTGANMVMHTGIGSVTVQGGYGGGSFSGGTAGGNLLVAGTSATTLYAGGDGDVLVASGGTGTTMNGWGGNEVLTGEYSQGTDVFNQNGANVLMVGGAGTNVFNVGTGHADIVAGLGTDLFTFTNGNANRTYIADFNVATSTIHLAGFAPDEVGNALATATSYQGSEILSLRDGTSITFGNVTGLTQSSFV